MPVFLMNKHFLVQPHHFHVGEFFKIIGNQVLKISSSSFLSSPRPTRTDTHKFPITVALLCYAVGGWSGLFGLSWISPSTLAAAQSASTPGRAACWPADQLPWTPAKLLTPPWVVLLHAALAEFCSNCPHLLLFSLHPSLHKQLFCVANMELQQKSVNAMGYISIVILKLVKSPTISLV